MKIIFTNDGAYAYASGASSAVGGSERDQWLLGASLARFGWVVKVAVRNGLKPGHSRIINGVEFVGIGSGQILFDWYRFLSSERPDWLFWECASHLWGPLVEIAKISGSRTIFHVGFDSDVRPRNALFQRRRWWPLYAWGLERTDRIFVQHDGQFSRLCPRWQTKARSLPKVCSLPGVLDDELKGKPHARRERYVAWVGMLRYHKRPDLLLDITRRVPSIRFVICGGVSDFMTPPGYGERLIQEFNKLSNVEYMGQVAPEKAQQIISNAALLLCTSEEEGFPNTFTQAWSSGTPVVSLKVDPDNLIEKMGLGSVTGTHDYAIADIKALVDSPERRDEIAARAQRYISQAHSAASVVRAFEDATIGVRT